MYSFAFLILLLLSKAQFHVSICSETHFTMRTDDRNKKKHVNSSEIKRLNELRPNSTK